MTMTHCSSWWNCKIMKENCLAIVDPWQQIIRTYLKQPSEVLASPRSASEKPQLTWQQLGYSANHHSTHQLHSWNSCFDSTHETFHLTWLCTCHWITACGRGHQGEKREGRGNVWRGSASGQRLGRTWPLDSRPRRSSLGNAATSFNINLSRRRYVEK